MSVAQYPLLALPMFVLVGVAIFDLSGIAQRVVDFAVAVVGLSIDTLPLVATVAVVVFPPLALRLPRTLGY